MDFSSFQITNLIQVLQTPAGMFGALLCALLIFFSTQVPAIRWAVIGSLLVLPAITSYSLEGMRIIPPFEQIRWYGRPLTIALLGLLAMLTAITPPLERVRPIGIASLMLLVYQFCFDAAHIVNGDLGRGLFGFFAHGLAYFTLSVGLRRWLRNENDVKILMRTLALSALIFVGSTLIQAGVNRPAMMMGNRLTGLTGNPNYNGLVLAIFVPVLAAMLVSKGRNVFTRIAIGVLMGFALVFLGWTGSRAAFLMAGVTLVIMFRARLGSAFLLLALAGGMALFASTFFEEAAAMSSQRLFDTSNNRTELWYGMWTAFLKNPVSGKAIGDLETGTENSLLLVAVRSGVIGLGPLLVAIVVCAISTINLWRRRVYLDADQKLMADYAMGAICGFAVVCILEGYMAGVVSTSVYYLYIVIALIEYYNNVANEKLEDAMFVAHQSPEFQTSLSPTPQYY